MYWYVSCRKNTLSQKPQDAAKMGRDRNRPLRPDWETVKDDVMRKAVLRKFANHTEIRNILLSTKNEEIVENSPIDYYWGCGADGSGKNKLGIILMEVREILRQNNKTLDRNIRVE